MAEEQTPISKLQQWAKYEKKTEVPTLYINDGFDGIVEFDETEAPKENTTAGGSMLIFVLQ